MFHIQILFVCAVIFILAKAESSNIEEDSVSAEKGEQARDCRHKNESCQNSVCCDPFKCKCKYYGLWEYKCFCKKKN
uniref:U17-Deinotoxin-Dsu1c_1 n=1 Tax=Deinopis subrufa TaxID=1905329 RepID=A0A4V2H9X7_DEISU